MKQRGYLSCDVDSLRAIYKGIGCSREGGYTFAEYAMGAERMHAFFAAYGIAATLFVVGEDLHESRAAMALRQLHRAGYEMANHTLTHPHDFSSLPAAEKEREIRGTDDACTAVFGEKPIGFRAPGWNVSDDCIPILAAAGYRYDSSVFPTLLMPLLQPYVHWICRGWHRYTKPMGSLRYMLAPNRPYRCAMTTLARRGNGPLHEFPLNVLPVLRVPVWLTLAYSIGSTAFLACLRMLQAHDIPVHVAFHLSDFVDYSHPEFAGQIPALPHVYVPRSFMTPLAERLDLFKRCLDLILPRHDLGPLRRGLPEVTS